MKTASEILKYAEQYEANRRYHLNYKKSKNPDAYLRTHESQLLLYDGAKGLLQRSGIDLKSLDSDRLRTDYAAMEKKKNELQNCYKAADKELQMMEKTSRKSTSILKKICLQKNPFPVC